MNSPVTRGVGEKMRLEELDQWQESFEQFHARFADLFGRSESRQQAKNYLRGLLANVGRKNSRGGRAKHP
jgi:hypothetical protein